MALTGHHFVEQGLARLAGFLHVAPQPGHDLKLRATTLLPSDVKAVSQATAIYGGQQVMTAEAFISLDWLESFARSGRQLLVCHALRLLEGWNRLHRNSGKLESEAAILNRLVFSSGQCAALMPPDQLSALSIALQTQINRFSRLKTADHSQTRIKAMALLAASGALQKSHAAQTEALQLMDQCLPQLIASDGGPSHDCLPDYVTWLQELLTSQDIPFTLKARNALDRAGPFLSMLLGSDARYCFDAKVNPVATVHTTSPLRLAPVSRVAHLSAGKCVAIATPCHLNNTTQLSISANGHLILEAGLFLHGPDDDQSVEALECDAGEAGHWLRQVTPHQQRTVFLSAKGDDLRVEEQLQSLATPRWMRLNLSPTAKVSVARNGTQATIALDGRNLWQLTVRGATLLAPAHGDQWLVKSTGPRVNWALKRINRTATRQGKSDLPELPF